MASGFFFGGMAPGILAGADAITNDMKLQSLMQLQVARDQSNQKHADYMKLRSELIDHMGQTATALKNGHKDWTDLQVASNPAMVALKNMLQTFDKNLKLPDTADSIIAGLVAGPSEIQTARMKAEATGEAGLRQSEVQKNLSQGAYYRAGIPTDTNNPDRPGLPQNGPALGDAATFNQRFAQANQSDVAGNPADEYLKSLPEDLRDDILGVYSGKIPLNTFSTRTYRGQTKSQRQLITEGVEKYGRLNGQAYDARQVKADTNSLTKLQQSADSIKAFEDTAIANGDILVDLAKKVDRTGIPVVESWLRAGRAATGDPDVAKFNAQMTLWRSEVAKILTNPNITGQLTDTARAEIEKAIQPGASWQQIAATHELLKGDFGRRSQALDAAIYRIKNRGQPSGGTEGPGITVHGFTFTPTGQ